MYTKETGFVSILSSGLMVFKILKFAYFISKHITHYNAQIHDVKKNPIVLDMIL